MRGGGGGGGSADDKASLDAWHAHDAARRALDFCDPQDEHDGATITVNLIDNPERFTGYIGDSPRKVWMAIYQENCFKCVPRLSAVPGPVFRGAQG